MYLFTICMPSLEKCLFCSSANFLIERFDFPLLSSLLFIEFLTLTPYQPCSVQIYSPILYIVFSLCLWFPLLCKSFLLWYMSHFFCLFVCFIAFAFCVKSKIKNPHQEQCQVAYHLHFHLKVLWFHVLFSSLISFDLVFWFMV